jgi:uncharacterized protein (TIGR02466 family)
MQNATITELFPTLIYTISLDSFKTRHDAIYKKVLEYQATTQTTTSWRCDTYNTLDAINLTTEPLVADIIEACKQHVREFSKEYGVIHDVVDVTDAWLNLASPGQFQEYHMHSNNHFSAVYYIKTPKHSGNLVVRSHEAVIDMCPVPVPSIPARVVKGANLEPQEGMLVIFRSNLQHMVDKNMSDEDRVSLAVNFVIPSSKELTKRFSN